MKITINTRDNARCYDGTVEGDGIYGNIVSLVNGGKTTRLGVLSPRCDGETGPVRKVLVPFKDAPVPSGISGITLKEIRKTTLEALTQ